MKKRLTAILAYALFWLLFFFTARLFFILTHFREAFQFNPLMLASTFSHGIKLDISAVGYVLLIPMLLMIPGIYFSSKWFGVFMKWYTCAIIIISSIIVVSDTLLYKYWGFRMDYTPLIYLKTPKEAMASVTSLQTAGVILGIILLSSAFIILYRKVMNKFFDGFERIRFWLPAVIFFSLFWASLLIPIRGGVGIAPINAGTVYFCDEMFLNHTAINVVWNLGSSVINQKPVSNPYQFGDLAEAKALADSLTVKRGSPLKVINNARPNILFIVLESFGSAFIEPLGGDSLTTPCFNRYSREGVLFTNFYASGNRTDKAMPSIINGYPAQPAVSIMKEPKKTQSLPGIVKTMKGLGYHTSFWYGGEINFANFNSFVINSGFEQIITMDNFSPEFYNSKWGVHDHVLFAALMDSMKNIREPFLKVVLTLSSHEPFEVPMEPVFKGLDDLTKFRNSIYYTDRSLGLFLDRAKTTQWWRNTLVVLVADHCRRNSAEVMVYSEEIFKIPMLWLGGALSMTEIRIDKAGSQVDIPVTILHQLDLDDNYPFAKDLLADGSKSFAFYTFNEGFGFITDSSKYIYDHKLGDSMVKEGKSPEIAGQYGKAYLQVLYDDFLNR
jgi:phosphoglycerol transferase MdoB-like AlkP superfamily enzyme